MSKSSTGPSLFTTDSEQIFDWAFTLHDRTRPRRHESSRTLPEFGLKLDFLNTTQRLDALELFRKQQVDFLIATDVAARVRIRFLFHAAKLVGCLEWVFGKWEWE
ncbi:ATP-dependent RNA helicase DRS1 [Striga asiatica]|uniref:ATP-dependent RNA helicase DRS1 n=1 Tax=Striga asiatica TaxID=4170 RepID=A0A5A7PR33_STRAF|nr:ATP-dependent RNA helicase DRS1 [Striga asiatica]